MFYEIIWVHWVVRWFGNEGFDTMQRQILGPSLESAHPQHIHNHFLLIHNYASKLYSDVNSCAMLSFLSLPSTSILLIALSQFTLHCSFHRPITQRRYVYSSLSPLDIEFLKGRDCVFNFCLPKTQSSTINIVGSHSMNEWVNECHCSL